MSHLGASIVAAGLLASCTDQMAPNDAAPPTGPAFLSAPATPGNSGIYRFQFEFFTIAVDSRNQLISFTGLASSIADFCAGLGQVNIMDLQLKPHDAGQINSHIVDRVASIQVVAEPPGLTDDLCAGIRNAPVLYRGTANFKRTDNLFGDPATVGRAASVGWTSEGVLTDVMNGGQVHYNEEVRLRIDTADVFQEDVSRIHIN
jgi:hypothetical protein